LIQLKKYRKILSTKKYTTEAWQDFLAAYDPKTFKKGVDFILTELQQND
jgi:hypothetical protein